METKKKQNKRKSPAEGKSERGAAASFLFFLSFFFWLPKCFLDDFADFVLSFFPSTTAVIHFLRSTDFMFPEFSFISPFRWSFLAFCNTRARNFNPQRSCQFIEFSSIWSSFYLFDAANLLLVTRFPTGIFLEWCGNDFVNNFLLLLFEISMIDWCLTNDTIWILLWITVVVLVL